MKSNSNLLSTAHEVQALADILRTQEMIAVDTEFIRESTFFPIIALIQVATEQESWLIDPLAFKAEELKPFFEILANPKVLKIFHAMQADQECLYTNYKVVATPSFDTAVGASLCGYGESIGLSKLLKEVMDVSLPKGHARTDWTVRPMPEQLMRYAHQDVHYLIPTARKLIAKLDKVGRRAWAFELSAKFENSRNYEPNPEGIALKLVKNGRLDRRGYAILKELVRWREERVRDIDLPRRRVADDDVLVDLASARPRDIAHLSAFRGLNRGEFKHSAEAILAAIRRGTSISDKELPEVPRSEVPDLRETAVIQLIQCFIKILAENLQISARHLVTSDDILPLLRKKFGSVEELVNAGLLSKGAAALVGEELLAIVQGKRGLSVRDGNVVVNRL